MGLLLMLVVVAGFTNCLVNALDCYQCTNVKTDADNSFIKKLFTGEVNPACSHPNSGSVPAVTCAYGYKCAYVEADVSLRYPIFGAVSMRTETRGCQQTDASDVCYTSDDDVRDIINGVLSLAMATDIEVDGKVCYCSEDLCDPNCGDDSWLIGDVCAPKWAVVLVGIVSVVATGFILTCCCCCCCCCRCCRSNPSGGAVIVTGAPMMVATATTTSAVTSNTANDIRGMENPGYYGNNGGGEQAAGRYTRLKECV